MSKSNCTGHLLKMTRQILGQYRAELNSKYGRRNWGFITKGQGESMLGQVWKMTKRNLVRYGRRQESCLCGFGGILGKTRLRDQA